jgi:hypothetical protein
MSRYLGFHSTLRVNLCPPCFVRRYSQAVPVLLGCLPAGHGKQQMAPPGFLSGLQSCGPTLGQSPCATALPIRHFPPASTHCCCPDLSSEHERRKMTIEHIVTYLISETLWLSAQEVKDDDACTCECLPSNESHSKLYISLHSFD